MRGTDFEISVSPEAMPNAAVGVFPHLMRT
jgi:hypothetical protein